MVVKTRVRIDAPPRQMSLGDTIAVVLQDLEQRVTSERLALYDKAWREGCGCNATTSRSISGFTA